MKTIKQKKLSGVEMAEATGITIKHSRAVQPKKSDEHGYCLTNDEYGKMTESFFQLESLTKILYETAFNIGNKGNGAVQDISMTDIANALEMMKGKVEIMGSLLTK
jgi:hypothetical protein